MNLRENLTDRSTGHQQAPLVGGLYCSDTEWSSPLKVSHWQGVITALAGSRFLQDTRMRLHATVTFLTYNRTSHLGLLRDFQGIVDLRVKAYL